MRRCLNPKTSPEKAFKGSKHLLTRYLEDFGCLGWWDPCSGLLISISLLLDGFNPDLKNMGQNGNWNHGATFSFSPLGLFLGHLDKHHSNIHMPLLQQHHRAQFALPRWQFALHQKNDAGIRRKRWFFFRSATWWRGDVFQRLQKHPKTFAKPFDFMVLFIYHARKDQKSPGTWKWTHGRRLFLDKIWETIIFKFNWVFKGCIPWKSNPGWLTQIHTGCLYSLRNWYLFIPYLLYRTCGPLVTYHMLKRPTI